MSSQSSLTTAEIQAVFSDEIADRGGTVHDIFEDGARLFARSLLPWVEQIRPGDQVQGGVALRATEREAWLHPYVFRQVCRNGAIMAQTLQSRHIERLDWLSAEEGAATLRDAIAECSVKEAFTVSAQNMRSAREGDLDMVLNLLPMLSHLAEKSRSEFLSDILERFFGDADQTRYGLMNAVTSLARDTKEPDLRWRLEELGGAIAAGISPRPRPGDVSARRARPREEALVG
jgi:hypothetical protein